MSPDDRIIDGRDPGATLAGRAASPHRSLFWEYNRSRAVRQGRYKLVRARTSKSWELYDLADDPGETTDLAEKEPDVAARLLADFDRWAATVRE